MVVNKAFIGLFILKIRNCDQFKIATIIFKDYSLNHFVLNAGLIMIY